MQHLSSWQDFVADFPPLSSNLHIYSYQPVAAWQLRKLSKLLYLAQVEPFCCTKRTGGHSCKSITAQVSAMASDESDLPQRRAGLPKPAVAQLLLSHEVSDEIRETTCCNRRTITCRLTTLMSLCLKLTAIQQRSCLKRCDDSQTQATGLEAAAVATLPSCQQALQGLWSKLRTADGSDRVVMARKNQSVQVTAQQSHLPRRLRRCLKMC